MTEVHTTKFEAVLFDIDEVVVASTALQIQAEQVTAQEMALQYPPLTAFDSLRNQSEHGLNWTRFRGMARVGIASVIWGIEETDELADEYRRSVVATTVKIANPNNTIFVAGAEKDWQI